jgi:tetratricopeptide (TPR) repeat protein
MQHDSNNIRPRLEKLLSQLTLPNPVTVSDIEDIIWNATNSSDFNRLTGLLLEADETREHQDEVIQLVQDAWNTLPHNKLGGKSPQQLVDEYKSGQTGEATPITSSHRKRKKLTEVFGDGYPDQTQLVKIGGLEWGFEFSRQHHEVTDEYLELQDSDITARQYEKQLRRIIELAPDQFDAASDLANFYASSKAYKQAKHVYEAVVSLAMSYLPPEFEHGKHHIIWAYLDNRPFLRLLAGYAEFIEQTDKTSKAIPLLEDIIAFNPNDNQGIRGVLTTAYLKTGKLENITTLASQYPEDITSELVVGNVLALFKLGRVDQARKYAKRNMEYQKHVFDEILKPSHQPPAGLMEDRVTVGGPDEAWYYWQDQGTFWEATPGAKVFLTSIK